jgi:hypothetical protein
VATIYRLVRLASSHRGGVNSAVDAEIRGVAKTNDQGPFTIANEIIAARLGRALGLPVPDGVVAEHSGKQYYLSLDVSKEGKTLPPIVPPDFVSACPRLAAGAVIFDIWIANSDRHASNVSFDDAFTPPRPSFFDHGHALLGGDGNGGPHRLAAAESDLGCTGRPPMNGNRHVLIDLVSSAADLREWIDRVAELPDFQIDDACQEAHDLGVLPAGGSLDAVRNWLQDRKARVAELVSNNQAEFSAITQWDLGVEPAP